MKAELLEAVRVYVRYETPDKDDEEETRRARNERVGEYTPSFDIPVYGRFLWDIHQNIMKSVSRTFEGFYRMIPPTEFEAWFRLTGTLVYPKEYDILSAMDRVYCEEANKELENINSKRREEQERQMQQAKKARRR